MNKSKIICFFTNLLICSQLLSLSISKHPICEVPTPSSLYTSETFQSVYVGDQSRFSTCSGVSWSPDQKYLATVNFEAGAICLYKFDQESHQCTLIQILYGNESAKLHSVENLSFSPDGTYLAVSVNHHRTIHIYKINSETDLIEKDPVAVLTSKNPNVHGIRFCNRTDYLAYTTVRRNSAIRIYKINRKNDNSIKLYLASKLLNRFVQMKPKSIDFTKDDHYAVVVYASNIAKNPIPPEGLIAIYKFDVERGILDPEPISIYRDPDEFKGGEDIKFYKDDSCFFVSDHVYHRIIVFEFDKQTGQIGKKMIQLNNPEARLSFPHGIGISPDGKYLAVANYGNDNFSIYAIDSSEDSQQKY